MIPAKSKYQKRSAFALIVSMIFVLVFSALAVAMFSTSSANMEIADNQHKANIAFTNAESGLDVMRFWLNRIKMPSSTPVASYFKTIVADLRADLIDNSISNLPLKHDGAIPPVQLESENPGTFSVQMIIDAFTPTVLQLYVTGTYDEVSRTIRVDYDIAPYRYPIFNYGLATRGPLRFPGNPTLIGANSAWEADVYIESSEASVALFVNGNTNFDGDINISNPAATADFVGDVLIAGDHGETAIANHVFTGVDAPEFPIPDTDRFRTYATGDVISAATYTKGMTIVNGYIPAGTNPTFAGSVIVKGILFIEQPNIVTFGSNLQLQGMIVADGDIEAPGTNAMSVIGNFGTAPYPADPAFDAIRHEIGSSIIAPGFSAFFSGNYSTIEGVVAVSGVHFAGNANAIIKGTVINYSNVPAVVEGNATMTFDRSASPSIPAGFDTHRILDYIPSSYSVVH